MRHTTLFISTLAILALPACEEDANDGGGGSFDPSVDESTPIAELDDDDEQKLCEEAERFAAAELDPIQTELTCMSVATFAAIGLDGMLDADACKQAYDDCLASPPDGEPQGNACELGNVADCDATVGEFVACWEEGLALSRELLDRFSCDAPGAGLSGEPAEMPACEALYAKCPELGEDMG